MFQEKYCGSDVRLARIGSQSHLATPLSKRVLMTPLAHGLDYTMFAQYSCLSGVCSLLMFASYLQCSTIDRIPTFSSI
jgi:hypothetical protein